MTFFNINKRSYNDISKVYQKKCISFGNNGIVYSWRRPQAFFKTKRTTQLRLLQDERKQSSFNRARNNVYRILSCNVDNSEQRPTFWTFTFNPSLVGDVKNLRSANYYFMLFRQNLNRRLGYNIKYLAVPEFHETGNVHYHVIFFNLPFIATDIAVFDKFPDLLKKAELDFTMNDIWVYGFTDVILLDGIKDIAAYVSKYMSKAFDLDKGNRTYGEKLYFCSKGLKRPIVTEDEVEVDNILRCAKVTGYTEYTERGLRIIEIQK